MIRLAAAATRAGVGSRGPFTGFRPPTRWTPRCASTTISSPRPSPTRPRTGSRSSTRAPSRCSAAPSSSRRWRGRRRATASSSSARATSAWTRATRRRDASSSTVLLDCAIRGRRSKQKRNVPLTGEAAASFFSLTPDRVLDAVEVGGLRCTGRCLPLRAFENRVYEVELEDERRLVMKFYRPGRWSREAILDEHAFLSDLAAAEVPTVAPLDLGTGGTLGEIEGILYAAFPKVRGRTLDELDAENRRRIGRTIGRMHAVGAARDAPHRPRLDVKRYLSEPLEILMASGFIPEGLAPRYRDVVVRIADAAAKALAVASALAAPWRVHRRRRRQGTRHGARPANPRRPALGQHSLDARPAPRRLRRLPGRPARAGPLAPGAGQLR